MKQKSRILLSVIMAILCIIVVQWKTGIYFETNDDRFLTEILSGSVTQGPEAHTVYVNYLLSLPLSLLYRITLGIPWYGGCLILLQLVAYSGIFESVLSCCEKKWETAVAVCVCGGLFLCNLYLTGLLQYTSTAALLAIAGYACLMRDMTSKERLTLFFVFQLLAYLLRSNAMLMIQPLGAAILFGLFIEKGSYRSREGWRDFGKWALGLIIVLAIGLAGQYLGYHSVEWRDYNRFNDAGTVLYDYYGTPDYEEVKDILERYQVTKQEYLAYCNYIVMDYDVSPECARELAAYTEEHRQNPFHLVALLGKMYTVCMHGEYLKSNHVLVGAWCMALLWILLLRKWKLLFPFVCLTGGKSIVWCYLLYKGRTPMRIVLPLFFGEMLLLVLLMWKDYAQGEKKKLNVVLWMGTGVLLLVLTYGAGQAQYRYVLPENRNQGIFMEGLREVQQYCMEHSDNRYVLDSIPFSYYKGSVWETGIYGRKNGVYSGSWYANSPSSREYLKSYFQGHEEDMHLIVYDDGAPLEVQSTYPAVMYFTEKFKRKPIMEERLTVSHGGSYLIWHFKGGSSFAEE